MYSEKIQYYSEIKQKEIIIPDDILVREGIACGDSINILAGITNEILEFQMFGDSCIQCKAMIGYLYTKYNMKNIYKVIEEVKKEYKEFKSDNLKIVNLFNINLELLRIDCIIKPMEIFIYFLENLQNLTFTEYYQKDTKNDLDCDACVSTSKINWRKTNIEKHVEEEKKNFPTEYRKKWMQLAKLYLNEEEINLLKKYSSSITDDDIKFFRKMKIDQMLYANMKKYKCDILEETRWKHLWYRIHRKEIVANEIESIRKYIKDNNLKAYFVKGALMQELYKKTEGIRVFLDYDILANSSEIAFQIGTFLFSKGFTIFTGVFSLKEIENKKDFSLYTGHFHMQKVINGQYRIIVDINFPGFPMGRIDLFYPKEIVNDTISYNDQFIITLCHLFKHKDVFMKDINDLYLLIKLGKVNFTTIIKLVKENNLNLFFKISMKYIFDNYDIPSNYKEEIKSLCNFEDISLNEWPYNEKSVYEVKKEDFNKRLINKKDNDRIYLFPLVIFKEVFLLKHDMKERILKIVDSVEEKEEGIAFLHIKNNRLILTTMGIFWDNSNSTEDIGRFEVEDLLCKLVKTCEIKNILKVPYLTKRQDKWFD